ncbi:hypothetical protein JI742_00245 [Piscinibacter sp. Jin2]|uniref:DUF1571 domain-containing protein n=1 Tax=Aquariibacter lacus TaxID=2801332 RepID=A0A9X1BQ81_9BURK|nr:hypothetical protein [Piscinibacter lacus]MBL0718308.1 hypothetical protein [Piscinibacter lacus]
MNGLAALLLALSAAGVSAQAQGQVQPESPPAAAPEPSEAEQLVFMRTPLATMKPPTKLVYAYRYEGSTVATPVDDRAILELLPDSGGKCCNVKADFLAGPRRVNLPLIEQARGNPVVLFFLEREVRRLNELTKGSANHFRKRIRLALVDQAKVSPREFNYAGRTVKGSEVRVQPFLLDPNRPRYEKLAQTEYVFLLSPEVPGELFEIRSTLPAATAGAAPETVERLTLQAPTAP